MTKDIREAGIIFWGDFTYRLNFMRYGFIITLCMFIMPYQLRKVTLTLTVSPM